MREVHHILRQSKVRRWNLPDRKQRNDAPAEIYRKLVSYLCVLRARHTVEEYKSRTSWVQSIIFTLIDP